MRQEQHLLITCAIGEKPATRILLGMVNIQATSPPDPMQVGLAVSDLSVAYDRTLVLADVSLKITPGEIVALLGPSGSGKTTLLRAIAGLERPVTGSVALGKQIVSDSRVFLAPERRRVGMVFQDGALFPHLDVFRNVAYGLKRVEQSSDRVTEALAMVGLESMAKRMPGSLSGGQQQRVALARALAPRPEVLLLDEPFSSLDATLRLQVRAEIHLLLVELGITTLFVTHDQEEAFVLGDRVAVLRDGQIAQVGSPDELYLRPSDRWVATFVGDANLFPVTSPGKTCITPVGKVPLKSTVSGNGEVLLRPEDLTVTTGNDGVVEMVEYYGHDAMIVVRLDEGTAVRARTAGNLPFGRGDRVGVTYVGSGAIVLML